ncbi:MAG: terminase small subunit [Candidatus Azotimanducaceae bacterium]
MVTPKQTIFVHEYLRDLNATRAARDAGFAHPNVQGSQILAKPHIKKRLAEAILERSKRLQIDADWVVSQLEKEAADQSNSSAVRVRALELLGKHLGVFSSDKLVANTTTTLFADI